MIRRTIALAAALLAVAGIARAGADETNPLAQLVGAIRKATPEMRVEVDRGDATHATCWRGDAQVDLYIDQAGLLRLSAVIVAENYRRDAVEKRVREINDRLDVGTLWWEGGRLALTHYVAAPNENLEAVAQVVERMALRATEINAALRSIARS